MATDPSKLLQQLNQTGLQQSDIRTYQVIKGILGHITNLVPSLASNSSSGGGIPGPIGPAGKDGADGADGIDGTDGEDGLVIPGPIGPPGKTGIGIPGYDGIDGEDGLSIPGTPGTSGSSGQQGIPGQTIIAVDGVDGEDGFQQIISPINVSGVIQTVQAVSSSVVTCDSTNSGTYVDATGLNLTITPVSASNKIRLQLSLNVALLFSGSGSNPQLGVKFINVTSGGTVATFGNVSESAANIFSFTTYIETEDSLSNINPINYKVQVSLVTTPTSTTSIVVNRVNVSIAGISTFTAQEISPSGVSVAGRNGATGPQGQIGVPGIDGIDAEDIFPIPGIPGPQGPAGTGDVTQAGTNAFTGTNSFANNPINLLVGQIQFPATQNPSSNANTLDDYEEGTWTPTIGALSGGPATYLRQVGIYRKIGQVIHVWFDLIINSPSSLSGQCFIAGLPYNMQVPTSFAGYAGSVVYWDSMATSLVQISILAFSTGTGQLFLYGNTGASGTMATLDASAMNSSSSRFIGYCPYISTS